jgi:hypothetical protein
MSFFGLLPVLLDGCGGYGESNHEVPDAVFYSLLFSRTAAIALELRRDDFRVNERQR